MSQAVQTQNGNGKKYKSEMHAVLDKRKGEIKSYLPSTMDPERFIMICLRSIAQNPRLGQCSPASLYTSITKAAEAGLEPDGRLGHLVPYNTKDGWVCQFISDYKGLIWAAKKYGDVAKIVAHEVCENDTFEFEWGLDEKLRHIPAKGERGPITHFYAHLRTVDGFDDFDVMTLADVNKIRARSKSGDKGPWATDFVEMGRKTAVRRLLKYSPIKLVEGVRLDHDDDGIVIDATAEDISDDKVTRLDTFEQRHGGEETPHDPETGEVIEDTLPLQEAIDGEPVPAEAEEGFLSDLQAQLANAETAAEVAQINTRNSHNYGALSAGGKRRFTTMVNKREGELS